jgi:hypothetical protein
MTMPLFRAKPLSVRDLCTDGERVDRRLRREARTAKSRRTLVALAALGTALVASGCGVGSSNSGPTTDWMVKVQGNFANIYSYPDGTFPGTSGRVKLGPSGAKDSAAVTHAASQLGVPMANVTDVSGK